MAIVILPSEQENIREHDFFAPILPGFDSSTKKKEMLLCQEVTVKPDTEFHRIESLNVLAIRGLNLFSLAEVVFIVCQTG